MHIVHARYIEAIGDPRCEKIILVLRKGFGERSDKGAAVMPQPGCVLVSPFCVEADVHGTKLSPKDRKSERPEEG